MAPITNHPQRIGKYEILSVLGRGGMGVVYQARDTVIDRIVAVKTISPDSAGVEEDQVERLLMEARSAGRLHHPNIVTVFDFGREGDLSYIVMEYAEGVDLGHVVSLKQPLALATRIDIILQICEGLAFAHDRGVTHRDMKPANVRLTFDGTAKILDFGLARFDDTHLTKSGFISGTVAYMSPERLQGQTGKSDDIFALGAIAYELLTSRQAFQGSSAPEIIFKIVSESPPPVSTVAELPPELDAVIGRSMAREVSDRFPSVQDFADALTRVVDSEVVQQFISSSDRSADFVEATRRTATPWARDASSRGGDLRPYATEAMTEPRRGLSQNASTEPFRRGAAGDDGVATQVSPIEAITYGSQARVTETEIPGADPAATLIGMPLAQPSMLTRSAGSKPLWKPLGIGLSIAVVAAAIFIGYQSHHAEPSAPVHVIPPAKPSGGNVLVTPGDQRVARASRDLIQLTRKVDSRVNEARAGGVLLAEAQMAELNRRMDALGALAEKGEDETVRIEGAKILADYDEAIKQSPRAGPAVLIPAQVRPRKKALIAAAAPKPEPASVHAAPAPVPPSVATPVAAAPSPVPAAAPPPVEPAAAGNPKGEITTFIHNVGKAYQGHDTAFFARNYLPYSDKFGEAIRRSASTLVDIQIDAIEIEDPNHARVVVTRTDTLDNSVPPATQHLIYLVEKQSGQWKIVKFVRP